MPISLRRLLRRDERKTDQESGAEPDAPTTEEQQERLARLQELRDQGLLTDAEFAQQRHRILGPESEL
jgi:hypothetical protein